MKKRDGEFYDIFGVEFRRVTSILGRLKRFGLEEWQATCAIDFMIRELAVPLQKGWMSIDQLKETDLEKTRKAALDESRKRMKAAQDLGRKVHKVIHDYYAASQDKALLERLIKLDPEISRGIKAFLEWERFFHVDMIASEKQVYSFEHGFAGTLDLEAEVVFPAEDYGEDAPLYRVVADFKTGNPDPATIMQLGAYVIANEEMTKSKMDGGVVVYLDKETGVPRWKIYKRPELEPAINLFLALKYYVDLETEWKKKEPDEGEPSEAATLPPINPFIPADSPSAENAPDGSPSSF
jgi:CRISPR/Cas system-associated exonuclease Cas4 (RecB family)